MKKILLLMIVISFTSCKKEKKVCYSCQSYASGQLQYVTKCGGDGHFRDTNGDDMQCIQVP